MEQLRQHQAALLTKTCQALFLSEVDISYVLSPDIHRATRPRLDYIFFTGFVFRYFSMETDCICQDSKTAVLFFVQLLVTHWEFSSICASLTQFSPRPRPTVPCPEHMCSCRGISDPHHAGQGKAHCRHDTGPDSSLPSSQSICQEQGWPSGLIHWSYSALKTVKLCWHGLTFWFLGCMSIDGNCVICGLQVNANLKERGIE